MSATAPPARRPTDRSRLRSRHPPQLPRRTEAAARRATSKSTASASGSPSRTSTTSEPTTSAEVRNDQPPPNPAQLLLSASISPWRRRRQPRVDRCVSDEILRQAGQGQQGGRVAALRSRRPRTPHCVAAVTSRRAVVAVRRSAKRRRLVRIRAELVSLSAGSLAASPPTSRCHTAQASETITSFKTTLVEASAPLGERRGGWHRRRASPAAKASAIETSAGVHRHGRDLHLDHHLHAAPGPCPAKPRARPSATSHRGDYVGVAGDRLRLPNRDRYRRRHLDPPGRRPPRPRHLLHPRKPRRPRSRPERHLQRPHRRLRQPPARSPSAPPPTSPSTSARPTPRPA